MPATAAQVDCPMYANGWVTRVPNDSPQAYYIRKDSGRRFIERYEEEGMVEFHFEPGQECFQGPKHQHRILLGRTPIFIKETVERRRRMDWTEFSDDMNENAYRRNKVRQEG